MFESILNFNFPVVMFMLEDGAVLRQTDLDLDLELLSFSLTCF